MFIYGGFTYLHYKLSFWAAQLSDSGFASCENVTLEDDHRSESDSSNRVQHPDTTNKK